MEENRFVVRLIMAIGLFAFTLGAYSQTPTHKLSVKVLNGEKWWSGVVKDGHLMPFNEDYQIDTYANNKGNQIQPLLLSSQGRVIWSEASLQMELNADSVHVSAYGMPIILTEKTELKTLRDAFLFASDNYFPPSGDKPHELFFTSPQYNTWIELIYNQNQKDVLNYARQLIDNGFPPGVIMIDDNWQEDYGKWQFHPGRFPDPKAMMDELHQMGFKVMMWVCPFVSPDSDVYRKLAGQQLFIREADTDQPKMIRWWNGVSAVLDFTHPDAVAWFDAQLQTLVTEYGVDGFKFDAGDSYFYEGDLKSYQEASPNEHTLSFQKFGLKYPLNEYRASFKMGGQPLAQRLHDKGHNWEDLQMLIPQMGLQGILGYPFNCPDMIGGGEYGSFLNLEAVDQDLVVRSAQLHALMPMMQFSVAPWRVLDDAHLQAVMKAVKLREQYLPQIMSLIDKATSTGEPAMRLMEYVFPHQGFAEVKDQFMLGDKLLVAPMLSTESSRLVQLPAGKWKWNGKTFRGNRSVTISVALDELPVFTRLN